MLKHAFVALLLILGASVAHAQELDKPLLLVAAPDLEGPYSHTAVLVVPMAGQHVGFILNRATEVKLATLFPEHAPSAKVSDPVYFGGPESVNAIFAVVPRNPGGAAVRLFGDLFVTVQADMVDRIIEQTPNDARYYAGYVGWRPGELAAELEAGFWYTADPDADLVFKHDTGRMWETLIRRLGKHLPPAEGMQEV
jgi:putative transcriptional regulator